MLGLTLMQARAWRGTFVGYCDLMGGQVRIPNKRCSPTWLRRITVGHRMAGDKAVLIGIQGGIQIEEELTFVI